MYCRRFASIGFHRSYQLFLNLLLNQPKPIFGTSGAIPETFYLALKLRDLPLKLRDPILGRP
jgi:hypothetical protein